ncbi:predicted protein [Naegleria gruberi]|uniref:Predicted protein n=1 Tax=Naegleria gruberi TaxID=5762 RepID=D2UXU5_NAEGR|nr:uncharacterized protein NAEGRDRAFT_61245 [Naegleria gruberi]EFC50350.1 predicted protein [Naegleria gruberi]|eukprot:XP_002683094.1 predicted protein [Naegleria gruberi strain NEG-M]
MDSYILALTHSGYLYINEGGTTFTDMGLNVDYFSNPSNLIVNIFATSYSFFIRTRSGEVYYVEQGLSKMVKSSLLSFKSFNPSAGRYHLASISTNTHDYGLFEVIGYNKLGNLGIKTSTETVKETISVPKVSKWIQCKDMRTFDYRIAANFFNTIVYRVKKPELVSVERFKRLLFSSLINDQYVKETQNIHNPFLEMFNEYSKRIISTRNFHDISILTTDGFLTTSTFHNSEYKLVQPTNNANFQLA